MRGRTPWYASGLAFECQRCGACCRGPGNVWISEAEVANLAVALEMTEEELRSVYTRRAGPRRRSGTVLRTKRNQDCVFWKSGSGCSIYAHRPRQCRTYPFWEAIVHDEESWQKEASVCRGIGCGPVREASEIAPLVREDGIPQHRTRLRTDSATHPASHPATDPASHPATDPASHPATDPASHSATDPATARSEERKEGGS